jgi:membrane-associated protein
MSIAGLLFIDPEFLMRNGGLFLACLIVYASTGLFFCFFLPSGAILFSAGAFVSAGELEPGIVWVSTALVSSSILGNLTGYWFGRKTGHILYERKDSRFFKQKNLRTAESFYNKYGWLALTMGLYLPIIRTFACVIAGVVKLRFERFLILTIAGSAIWVLSFVLAGYFIGSIPMLKPWLKYIVIAFILLVTVPLIIKVIMELKKLRREQEKL